MKIRKILGNAVLMIAILVVSTLCLSVKASENGDGEEYELRVLTFEDEGENNYWSGMIVEDQYNDSWLYGGTTRESEAYKWHDKGNTERSHTLPFNYGSYSYWGGGHAISNYASTDIESYGSYMSQLTVFKDKEVKEGVLEIESDAGMDKYNTEPVPEGTPIPVEPEETVISESQLTCTLSVRCDTVLKNLSWLEKEKLDIIPRDGIIYEERTVTFYEGESVFNLLAREMKKSRIHMEFENTPIYNSAYIEGIANLYEFDCGELSGWMYKVNGWFPNYGCSRYQLKAGDKVEWVYTCDLGVDVGGYYAANKN